MAKRKKSYNLILFELQQEELMKEQILGHKTASNMALEQQAKDEYLAPITRVSNSGSFTKKSEPIKNVSNQTYVKQDKNKWFNTGAFDDGYQFGDLTKTLTGTATDLSHNLGKGIAKILEGTVDTGAYLLGGGAKLIGQDDFADSMQNFIKKDLVEESGAANVATNTSPLGIVNNILNGNFKATNSLFKEAREDTYIQKNSLLDEKSDSLIQSAGQLAGTVGLQAVGVPWFVTTGVTSFGGGTQEAFQNDATYGEAGTYALISAGAEVLTEKLSGGISFGGKTLDAGLTKQLSKSISDKTIRTLTKYGFDMVGEAGEEVLTEVLQNVGKKLTFEDEKTWQELLLSEESMEQYLDAAIGGAVLGGGANVVRVTNSIKTGRDYDTGLSAREEQVVEARVQEIVNEQQASGKTLTDKDISKIEEDVITDIKKGYISTDLIENTIGKKLTVEQEAEIEAQLNELLQQSKIETDPQAQQQIQEQMEVLENQLNTSRDLDLSQDSYLLKSYQEKELKKQNYTYEKTNNAIEDGLRESASKVMNNTTRSHELVDTVVDIALDTNTKYEFTNTEALKQAGYNLDGKTVNGLVTADGKVLINIDSNKALETILGHETTHLLEGTAEYKALQDFTIEYAKQKGTYEDTIARLNNLYKGTNANVNNEFTADMVGDLLFTDQAYIESLSAKQPNVFQRIYNYIKHIYKKATAGSKEARQLEDLKYKFDQAYKNMKKQTDTNTKYSLYNEDISLYDYKGDIKAEGQGFTKSDKKMLALLEKNDINAIDNQKEFIRTAINRENSLGNKLWAERLKDAYYRSKKEREHTIKQYLEKYKNENLNTKYSVSENKIQGLENYSKDDIKTITSDYIKQKLEDNGIYNVDILDIYIHGSRNRGTARTDSDLDIVFEYDNRYDDDHIEREDDLFNILNEEPLEIDGIKVDINPITESETGTLDDYIERSKSYDKEILSKQSTTDNQGRTLTKEQQEYFKDSKVRDENGNLLTLYHGTNSEFNVFKRGKKGYLGAGIYLSDEQSNAEKYTDYGIVKEVYADIKNPLNVTSDIPEKQILKAIYGNDTVYNRRAAKQGLATFIVTSNDLKKLQEKGYDGIIWKYPSGNEYMVFNSKQLKNIDNTNPTSNPDIRYSLSEDTQGRKLSEEQINRYKNVSDKLKDENGNLKVYYHGTKRADRVGTVFDPNKATSGPMAFFTDNADIAKSYSENKADTSLSREYDTEYDLFKVNGQTLDEYWNSLNAAKKQEIREKANNVGLDDDFENIIYEDRASENSFGDQYKWRLNREYNGNPIKSLYSIWIEDGNIMYEDISKFKEVLELSGIENVEYLDPYKTDSKVYETYLNIKNPFDTSEMSEDIINQFKEASKTATIGEQYSADLWDKSNITPEAWIDKLESDIKEGTTHAWTVIPDWVTDVLKQNGYDGIVDIGGKHGGQGHQVAIPFYSEQVKSVDNENPTDNPDINMSLSAENEIAPTGKRGTYGKDVRLEVEEAIAPLQETIESLTEQVQTLQDNIVPIAEQYAEAVPMQEVQPTQPTLEEVQNLMDIRDNKSGSEYARAFFELRDKYGQANLYKSLNEYYSKGTVTQPSNVGNIDTAPVSQEVVEQQGQEAFNNITENEMPPSFEDLSDIDFETNENTGKVESPFDERDIDEVGNRKVKAYQYENPEVRPYFQAEAQNMMYDLDNTIKGEKIAIQDEEGYITDWAGITRQTTEAIAYLKDNYGYSYDQIRKGLNDIIEDNGKENNAVAKRIEFMLDERLREGYTTSDGIPIPPNQEYINFLNEKQITEYNKKAFNALSDNDIPVEIADIEETAQNMPVYEKIEPRESVITNENAQTQQSIPLKTKMAQNVNMDVIEAKQRSWAETSTESDVIKGKVSLNDLDVEKINYIPITNKDTLAKANAKLSNLGYERALKQFNSDMGSGKMLKPEDITLGQRLIQEALAKGDKATAIEVLQDITILGTELGQVTQALSIIQRMTPAGQLRMLEKTVLRGKLKGDKAFDGVELTDDMKNRLMECYNEDGQTYDQDKLSEVMEQIKQELADQMPVTKMDKINAWRYFAMLGNPKTHIRNLVSNVAMKGTVAVKNAVARTFESIAPIENRTKTWKTASEEVSQFAKQTALEMKDIISGENQVSVKADIKSKRKIFKTEFLNKITNGNSDLMSKEDWWFSKGAFESSFREFLTANGISTQEDIQNNAELVEKGKQYAVEQAQIATFRQYSWLSNKINEIERKNAATQIAVGSVIPFKKTPINIAKTGLSYSPLGALKSLTYDIYQVQKGNMEASTAIDHIAQGLTGSAVTLLGYMLSQMGFLNGAGDDDKEGKYDYYLGKQGYSLNIGDSTYSLSWLSPIAMPLLVGANFHEQLVEKEEWNPDVVMETLAQTLDPLSEMSFLSSLDDVMSSYDSGIEKFASIGQTAIQNYATQFVPTLSSQIAGTMDDTKRTTKVSGDSTFKQGEELYNQLIYKIPILRETLEPSTDIWGNEVKQSENLFQRAFENFISPYARKESIATEIDEELKDLYAQTGDNGILPNIPYNYVKYDGEKYNMSAEEYTDYKKTYGQTANDLLEDLFETTTYKNADSEERTDMVNDVYDYARDIAHKEYLAKEGVDYTNTTDDGKEVYKDNAIKGAIENDMSVEEYRLFEDDPEEYKFLMEKDYDYRRKYFDTNDTLKDIEKSYKDQKEGVDDEDELDVLSAEKKTNIIENIVNSGLEDTEKASLYKKYYNTDTVDTIVKSAINIDNYLTYETKEFKADKNEKGNSILGSRKDKVINYVNTLDMDIPQKAILIKSTNTFKFNDYNNQIVDYVGSLDIDYEDKVRILKDLDMTVDDEGNVYWD